DAYVAHLGSRIWVADDRDLLELANRIRAVRNPTLLGDVSPRAAADTLRDALPGVSDDVLTATAEALAESDATREAFRRDRDAAEALDRFADAWAGHVVEVVAQAHSDAERAVSAATSAKKELQSTEKGLVADRGAYSRLENEVTGLKEQADTLRATIRALE